ncbi:MAG: type I polyketide synthase, partial [Nannocystaceae bacterium]
TACSSSLVALHSACRALKTGECDRVIAGGVNLVLEPDASISLHSLGALSKSGRCRAFAAEADGFVRAEGAGVLILERLGDAIRGGHPVLGLVRGSAVNHDGRSLGPTAPNGPSQQAVIRSALADAGISPASVDVLECHGTGTILGDPIELHAAAAVYGEGRQAPLRVGSVKSNIGHTESAAGIAGVIKGLLALHHREVPATLHAEHLNPNVDWSALPIEVVRAHTPWQQPHGPRRLGVSSFGISGTNAHIILEEAPISPEEAREVHKKYPDAHEREHEPRAHHPHDRNGDGDKPRASPKRRRDSTEGPHLLLLSARDSRTLQDRVHRLGAHLGKHPAELRDLAATLARTPQHFPHRMAFVARSTAECGRLLAGATSRRRPAGVFDGQARELGRPAFLFAGQGAQRPGMGRELYLRWPIFRSALDRCAAIATPLLGRPLFEVLWAAPESPESALLSQTAWTQPALFAFEYALAKLWIDLGATPRVVFGHSLGEFTAACIADAIDLEDAMGLVVTRGRLLQSLPTGGAMATVSAPIELVKAALLDCPEVEIAAINGPKSVVISGDASAIETVLAGQAVTSRRLAVSHAFHSPLMEPAREELASAIENTVFNTPACPIYQNVPTTAVSTSDEIKS